QYQYDSFGRLSKIINSSDTLTLPTQSYDYYINPSPPHLIASHARIVIGSSATLDTYTYFDSLGRKRETKIAGSSNTQNLSDFVTYNSRGLIAKSYVPYIVSVSTSFVSEISTKPFSLTIYDGLGRIACVTNPDNSASSHTYVNWTETTIDANGHKKDNTRDA